jgi:hypothetical protein
VCPCPTESEQGRKGRGRSAASIPMVTIKVDGDPRDFSSVIPLLSKCDVEKMEDSGIDDHHGCINLLLV